MSNRELEVKMRIDNSQAKQAISEYDAKLAASKQKAFDHFLSTNQAVKNNAKEVKALGGAWTDALGGIAAKTAIAVTGLTSALTVARAIGTAIKEAHDKAKGFANDFIDTRDQLRELAKTMGEPLTDAFVKANQQFNVAARMTPGEGLAYRNRFSGSGIQFMGKNLTKDEFLDLERGGAQLATINGIDPGIAGDLFGGVAGMFNYNKFGKQAGEKALAVGNQSLMVLQRGRGLTNKNVDELTKLNSATFSEQEKMGTTANPVTNAAMVSIAAELNPNEAALPIIDLLSEIRKKGGKAEPLMRAAGLNGTEDPIEIFKAIRPILEKEMQRTGLELDQVAGKFFEERGTRLLTTFINKGVIGGGFDDRINYAKDYEDPMGVQKEIAKFNSDPTAINRENEAKIKEQQLSRGQAMADLTVLKKEAEANLLARGEIDTGWTNSVDAVMGLGWHSWMNGFDPRQERITTEAQMLMDKRWPGGKMPSDLFVRMGNQSTAQSQDEFMASLMQQAKAAGGDLLRDSTVEENNRLLKENNDLMRKQGGGQTVPPALLINAAISARR